jgi:polyferredoxin
VLLGAGLGISRTAITLPILLTLGSGEKTVVSAFDAIQEMFADSVIPWIPFAVFIIFGILVGRATCAWVCPFGFLQDLMATVNWNRHEVSLRTHEGAIKVKYGILGMTLFFSGSLGLSLIYGVGKDYKNALGVLAQGPFSALSPEATLLGVVPVIARMIILYFLGIPPVANPFSLDIVWGRLSLVSWLLAIRLMIIVFVVALSFFFLRAFCRYLCPAGALLAIFSRSGLLGLKRNLLQCDKCGDCVKVCPMLVRIMDRPWEKMTDPECIMCLECTDACGLKAIKPTFP